MASISASQDSCKGYQLCAGDRGSIPRSGIFAPRANPLLVRNIFLIFGAFFACSKICRWCRVLVGVNKRAYPTKPTPFLKTTPKSLNELISSSFIAHIYLKFRRYDPSKTVYEIFLLSLNFILSHLQRVPKFIKKNS